MNMLAIRTAVIGLILTVANLPASAQWKPVFNGRNLDGFRVLGGTAGFRVQDGMIIGSAVAGSRNTFLATEKEYRDFVLEYEVKVEDTAMNSGMQIRSHVDQAANNGLGRVYGQQVEVDATSRKWSGGINDEARRGFIYPLSYNPAARQAWKTGTFNVFRVECSGLLTRTWLNGVPVSSVVDDQDSSGFLALQIHSIDNRPDLAGKRVWFKNLRIQEGTFKPKTFPSSIYVLNVTRNELSPVEQSQGYRLLFDGASAAGWRSARTATFPTKGWEIAGGELRVQPSSGGESTNGGDIISTGEYAAFDLSFQFKLTPGANSGVKYFVTLQDKTDGSAIGLEYQVLDDTLHPDAKLGRDGNRTLGSLYDLIKADKSNYYLRRIGDWNLGRVVVYPDNRVEHWLNGKLVLQYVRGSEEYKKLVAESKYKNWPQFGEAKRGHILLQDHGNAVAFRTIRIKEL